MAQVPSKVTLSRANTPTADGFTVAWSDLSNETAYHLEHTTSANFTTSTLITNISANATSHALTGLTPGTTYYVRVRGAAAGGNGTWSDVQANQLLSIDPGQTRYLSVAGVPHGASHSVNFTISDIFGSANSAGLAAGTTSSEASTIMLLGSDGSTAHTVFYNSSQNQWREGDTNKGSEIVGFGKGFMVRNNTASSDIFLLSGSIPLLDRNSVTVFQAGAPAGRLSLVTPSKTTPTSLRFLGLTLSNNTTTGLKRATVAKDADLLLIPDSAGGLRRYHFDGTNWRSGLRTVSDPNSVTIPAGGAFFVRKASGSSFEQWRPPSEVVTDGLILHLDAGNPDSYSGSGTTWSDLSGNGNTGTLTNGPTFSNANGGSIVFDAVNDRVTLANPLLSSTGNWTISSWFNLSALSILNKESNFYSQYIAETGNGRILLILRNDGTVVNKFQIFLGSGSGYSNQLITGTTTPTINTFYNLAATRNGSTFSLYVNGNLEASSNLSGINVNLLQSTPEIGGINSGNFGWVNGKIYITSIYNRALNAAEILQNYNATKRRFEDTDAKAYLDAVEAADGQALEADVRDAVDKFVKGCKADGIWTAIKASCILAGARTLNGALTPLVGTAPTNVGGNFSSGDYNRESGLKGNGSSKLLDSNRNNNADPQDSHHLAAWVSEADTQVSGNPAVLGTGGANSGESVLGYANSTGGGYFFRSRSSGAIDGSLVARQTGLHAISRTSSTNVNIKLPGHASSTTSLTSQTPRSSTIKVFGREFTPHWNGRIAFYSIGESLDLAKLDSRVSTLLTDLAAAIP